MYEKLININKWLGVALTCGLFPLFTGIVIFTLWWLTRLDFLMMLGLFLLLSGLVLFLFGLISLAIYVYQSQKNQMRGYLLNAGITLGILLVNFPIAAAILYGAEYLLSEHIIVINNQSDYLLDDISVTERDISYRLGALQAHDDLEKSLHFKYQESSVSYAFTMRAKTYSGTLFGYVSSSGGAAAVINIKPDGSIEVVNNPE